MKFKKLLISDVVLIEPQVFNDERGFFYEAYNHKEFENILGRSVSFVQDNHSKSSKGVLRGLHFQMNPFQQGKLVRVVYGEVWDVAVDIRKNSPTYGSWVAETLSAENKKQLWIPEGFAHGFQVISDHAIFLYKVTNYYNPKYEKTILWSDLDLKINWPITQPIISEKDIRTAIKFRDIIKE